MPSGVYERTDEMKKKISEGAKEARKKIRERKKLTKEEKEQEGQKVIKVREREVLKAVKDILQYMENQGRIMFIEIRKEDQPDILVCRKESGIDNNSRLYYLKTIAFKVKSTKGKQTSKEKGWQQKFELHGGEYYIVHSVDQVLRILSYRELSVVSKKE